ncbi:MAG: integration host factor subunit beta [bacterium]|nr:integration host factor subunit beta [bacterium]
MTKAELIEAVAAATNVLKQDAERIVATVLDTMVEALQDGSRIELRGFGSFGLRQRGARNGRNPATGEAVEVPPKRVCYFKPGAPPIPPVSSDLKCYVTTLPAAPAVRPRRSPAGDVGPPTLEIEPACPGGAPRRAEA